MPARTRTQDRRKAYRVPPIRDDSQPPGPPGAAAFLFPDENPPTEDPRPPETDQEPTPLPRRSIGDGLRGLLGGPRPAAQGDVIPTPKSSRDSEKPARVGVEEATIAIAGLVGVVAILGVWVVQKRTGGRATFRQPSVDQAEDIAAPLARMATRIIPAGLIGPILMDALATCGATGAYLTDGPLVIPNRKDSEDA
jgi:hypothetical protein